ncbi:hypothetical protein EMCRGX_G014663 [Ephydatia muelleri]
MIVDEKNYFIDPANYLHYPLQGDLSCHKEDKDLDSISLKSLQRKPSLPLKEKWNEQSAEMKRPHGSISSPPKH